MRDFEERYVIEDDKLSQEEDRWALEKDLIQRKQNLKEDKKRLFSKRSKRSMKKSTSKRLLMFLLVNCVCVQLLAGYFMKENIRLAETHGVPLDPAPIVAMIGSMVAEVAGLSAYLVKSAKENSEGGIVYETAMAERAQKVWESTAENDDEEAVG